MGWAKPSYYLRPSLNGAPFGAVGHTYCSVSLLDTEVGNLKVLMINLKTKYITKVLIFVEIFSIYTNL